MRTLHLILAHLTCIHIWLIAPKDIQSFEIFVTGEWRDSFDKVYNALTPKPNVNDIIRQGRIRTGPRGGLKLSAAQAPEKSLKAVRELTLFLKEFIENNFGKVFMLSL
jgi:hypothetical protein